MYLPYRFPKWWICLGRFPMGPWVDQIQTSRKSRAKPRINAPTSSSPSRIQCRHRTRCTRRNPAILSQRGTQNMATRGSLAKWTQRKKNAYYMRFDWKLDTQKSYHHFPYCFGYLPFLDTPIMFDWLQTQVPVQLSASLRMRSRTKSTISLPIV